MPTKKSEAKEPEKKLAPKKPAAPVVIDLFVALEAISARIEAERDDYASPVSGRLTQVVRAIKDAKGARWTNAQTER